MQVQHTIIKVNGVQWNILNQANWIIERLGIKARLIWKGKNHGKIILTNKVNGRILSQPFKV